MAAIADVYARLLLDDKGFSSDVERAAGTAGEKGGSAMSQRMGRAVTNAATVGGAALGGLFVAGIEGATAFEDQLRTINTVAGLGDAELAKLGDDIQQVARDTGKSTDDLTAGVYDLVSAGVSADDAISVLSDSAKLSVGALGSTSEAVDAVTTALNAYGLDASESTRVTDVLAKAVADGKVTISQIGASLAQVAPIAASAGISLEEVSAGYAALTAKGVPASQAATQMRAAISALLTPNEQLNRIQEKTGVNFAELARTEGLASALEKLRVAFAENGDALAILAGAEGTEGFIDSLEELGPTLGLTTSDIEKFSRIAGKDGAAAAYNELAKQVGESDSGFAKALGSVEALNFALITTGDGAEDFQQQIIETGEASGLAASQYEEKSKSVAEQGKRLVQTFLTFTQDVGQPFVGTLGQGVFALNEISKAFGLPIGPAKLLGGAVGGLAGRLAGGLATGSTKIASGLVGSLVPAIAGIVPAIGGALTGMFSAAVGILGAAIPLIMAALPFIIIGAIVAAIAILILNEDIRNAVFGFIGGILEWIGDALAPLIEVVGEAFATAFAIIGDVLGKVGELIGQAIDLWINYVLLFPVRVAEVFLHILGMAVQFTGQVVAVIGEWIGNIVGLILSIPGRIAGLAMTIVNGWVRIGQMVIGAVVGFVGNIVKTVLSIPGRIVGLIGSFANIARRAVEAFMGFILGLPGKVANVIGNIAGSIGNFLGGLIPKFQEGTDRVPYTGLAMLHEGEMVVPASAAESIRSGDAVLNYGQGLTQQQTAVNVTVNNPVPEPPSTSVVREMRKLAYMGVVS